LPPLAFLFNEAMCHAPNAVTMSFAPTSALGPGAE
jgi:hypothetical protein